MSYVVESLSRLHSTRVASSWAAAGLNNVILHKLNNFNYAADLVSDICSHEDRNVAGRVATLIWNLWQNRIEEVWNNSKLLPVQAPRVQNNTRWMKLQEGWIKCNVDAVLFIDQGITTTVREHSNGELQYAQSRQYNLKLSTLEED
ncbi:hypothetical protein TSUD_176820 [Trifolium subterraneum]|uniref:Uncharacterized protein n=1 Tax=Trifolium subterraneum TaxID=3900 RepID=A0A2Z6LSS3_TRISU|nr:hypothetical protein TSUD_176820 [Trifolium subterraneum]